VIFINPLLSYAALFFAIVIEVIGTMFLGKSEHFTRLMPTLTCAVFYAGSFYMLAQRIKVKLRGLTPVQYRNQSLLSA